MQSNFLVQNDPMLVALLAVGPCYPAGVNSSSSGRPRNVRLFWPCLPGKQPDRCRTHEYFRPGPFGHWRARCSGRGRACQEQRAAIVRRGRWFEFTHPDHFLIYYRHTYGSSSDNFAISYAQYGKSIGNGPLPAQVTADHSGQLVLPV